MSLGEIRLQEGKYVVAVSGGVDSVVLLTMLACTMHDSQLIVAHVNHGIREDAFEDEDLVQTLAAKLGLHFESTRLQLGRGASEAVAREARYAYLRSVCKKHAAKLVTAHHQDDLIETAVLNMIRGTGPHGLVGMLANTTIERPLLPYAKKDIVAYAEQHSLYWRDDSTNEDVSYLRNYIRKHIIPALQKDRECFIRYIYETFTKTQAIDAEVMELLQRAHKGSEIKRVELLPLDFRSLSYVMRQLLVHHKIQNIDKGLIERLSIAAKVLPAGKRIPLDKRHSMVSKKNFIEITTTTQ